MYRDLAECKCEVALREISYHAFNILDSKSYLNQRYSIFNATITSHHTPIK